MEKSLVQGRASACSAIKNLIRRFGTLVVAARRFAWTTLAT